MYEDWFIISPLSREDRKYRKGITKFLCHHFQWNFAFDYLFFEISRCRASCSADESEVSQEDYLHNAEHQMKARFCLFRFGAALMKEAAKSHPCKGRVPAGDDERGACLPMSWVSWGRGWRARRVLPRLYKRVCSIERFDKLDRW